MSTGDTVRELRAKGARDADDVTWGDVRSIYKNGSSYAALPDWAAQNMNLTKKGSEFVPGWTPAGQTVIIEEAAIIIRLPNEDDFE